MDLFTWLGIDPGNLVRGVLRAVVIIALTAGLTMVLRKLFRKWIRGLEGKDRQDHATFLSVSGHIAQGLVYFLGVMALADLFPSLQKVATSLLAGSGIVAVILGIAAKESAGNLVSGVLISLFKPFRVGDIVRYLDKDITGTIEEITMRHTIIRTFENKRLVVPNNIINSQVVENASYGDSTVCFFLDATVSYESDLDQAMELLAETVRSHPDFLDVRTEGQIEAGEPEVLVRALAFKESGIHIRAYVWARDGGAAARQNSELLCRLKRAFEKEGIEIPYPHRMVLVKAAHETGRPEA